MAETPKFKAWIQRTLYNTPDYEALIAQDLAPENLKFETKVNGKWTEYFS
jgi:hypothetical protein